MAEPTPNPDTSGQQTPPADPPQNQQQQQAPGPVPYERFQEVNSKAKQLEERLAKIEADQRAAGEKQLAEQGKYKELLEAREKELAEERASRMRLSVAAKKGLVGELAPLAARLQGATEAELEADADALLALAKKPAGPGVPPPSGGGRPANQIDLASMTPAQIRDAMAKGQIKLS